MTAFSLLPSRARKSIPRLLLLMLALLALAACDPEPTPTPELPASAPPALWVGEMQPAGGSSTALTAGESVEISVQVYRAGVTDSAGPGADITCTLHWGLPGQTWQDKAMAYTGDAPGLSTPTDNDRYAATIIPPSGSYGFTARCTDATGVEVWQADGDGQLAVTVPAAPQPPLTDLPRTVFIHLFEWKWTDIAQECENYLGPKGFAAVQVSPPNEHIRPIDAPDFAWWVRYQPVSYQLISRSGNRAEFIDMVQRCKSAGVDVYVDAVINHMTGSERSEGTAGTLFRHYLYPDLDGTRSRTFSFNNFHHCGRNGNDDIANYGDAWEVQNCELLNLADLDTGSPYVQARIAAYLTDLLDIGVAGFRLDAAKHVSSGDIGGILALLPEQPYIFQEVIDRGGEPISARDYLANGDVTEFNYGSKLSDTFLNGKLAWLESFGESWDLLPSADAVVFVDNHDNQRGHGGGGPILTHRDGPLYRLADIFMLAWPYGYPRVMSSYAWDGVNDRMGPPSDSQGHTNDIYVDGQPDCFGDQPGQDWICEHRWPGIAGMVGFHNATARNFAMTDWWSNGEQQIAFGRGDAGFVVINRESFPLTGGRFQTSLPPGLYCDVIHGELAPDGLSCTGPVVTVEDDGSFVADVESLDALAIHDQARLP